MSCLVAGPAALLINRLDASLGSIPVFPLTSPSFYCQMVQYSCLLFFVVFFWGGGGGGEGVGICMVAG